MSKQLISPQIGVADSTPKFGSGELYIDEKGNHYRYLQADGAVTADLIYSIKFTTESDGTITRKIDAAITVGSTPADGESVPCCISPVTLADGEYTWAFVGPGLVTLSTKTAVAADAIIYGSATAGKVDDAATACLIRGLAAISAIASATTGTFYAATPLYAVDLP